MEELTTITVKRKDKKIFKDLVNKEDTNQQKFFSALLKVMKKFKPEIKEFLK